MTERLPNFLYIGPDKAGSSWLHEVLIQHPDVFLSQAKDLYFFDRYYDRGLPWYAAQFRKATPEHAIVGEVCQDYLSCEEAAGRIQECLGEIRLMATVREPAARAFSSYLYMLKHGIDAGTFADALRSRPELVDHGRYAQHLRRFLKYFPRTCIHVALFDDLQRDPQTFIDAVTEWLGIRPMQLDESQLTERLPASEARSTLLARGARWAADWTRAHDGAQLVGRVKRAKSVQTLLYKPNPELRGTLLPQDAEFVRRSLLEDVIDLEHLLGLDLRGRWGWEAVPDGF